MPWVYLAFQIPVGEEQELVPIVWCDGVFAGAIVKCDCAHDWLIQCRHLRRTQVLCPKQSIDWSRSNASQELTFRDLPIGPLQLP